MLPSVYVFDQQHPDSWVVWIVLSSQFESSYHVTMVFPKLRNLCSLNTFRSEALSGPRPNCSVITLDLMHHNQC